MNKIYISSTGAADWKRFLAEPEKQWRTGYSAKALAYCWEEAEGFPASVKQVFQKSGLATFHDMEMLFAFPEHKVPLPGGGNPSQNDIFVLARSQRELISIAVEGKVNEPFGPTVAEWRINSSAGKEERLKYLCDLLGVCDDALENIRYQLLHRTASALIEGERFNAAHALMLVHSFSQEHKWFEDYEAFLGLFGKNGDGNAITKLALRNGIELFSGWVTGEEEYLTR